MSIIKAANNSQLIEMSEGIMENLSRILRIDCNNIEFENEKEEHINIAKALIERDSPKAEKIDIRTYFWFTNKGLFQWKNRLIRWSKKNI